MAASAGGGQADAWGGVLDAVVAPQNIFASRADRAREVVSVPGGPSLLTDFIRSDFPPDGHAEVTRSLLLGKARALDVLEEICSNGASAQVSAMGQVGLGRVLSMPPASSPDSAPAKASLVLRREALAALCRCNAAAGEAAFRGMADAGHAAFFSYGVVVALIDRGVSPAEATARVGELDEHQRAFR